jgi:hypothetical protein
VRIAFVVHPWNVIDPKDEGGGSSISMLTYQLARRLASMKNDVVIYSKWARRLCSEEMDENGILHHRLDFGFICWAEQRGHCGRPPCGMMGTGGKLRITWRAGSPRSYISTIFRNLYHWCGVLSHLPGSCCICTASG